MSLTALALVLGAGFLHASWNLILKRTSERLLVTAWGLLLGAVVFAPALIQAWPPPARVWPYAICSAAILLAYYTCLARAYEHGDFSLVYPVARGTAPAMLALWAVLFLGERPSAAGVLGIVAILGGLVVLGGAPLWSRRDGDPRGAALQSRWAALRTHARGSGLAFLVAFLVSTYSAIDGAGVRLWTPIPYVVLTFALSGSLLIPLLALRQGKHVFRVLRTHWIPTVVISVMTLAAYSLVLRAFQIAPVSYAGAAREVGIVFGALGGWLLLGERLGGIRTAGAVLVFVGIAALALAR